jgi:hypothetical protein
MANKRAISDWLGSLPHDREFSLEWAYGQMLTDHPRQAPDRSRCSRAITATKRFERWTDEQGVIMFRYGRREA